MLLAIELSSHFGVIWKVATGFTISREDWTTFSLNRFPIAAALALLFHVAGALGMIFISSSWFTRLTPLNLVLMFVMLLWTQERKDRLFYFYLLFACTLGWMTEIAGVHTGHFFGHYRYEDLLGPKLKGVPLLIGLYWFVIVFCSACTIDYLAERVTRRAGPAGRYAWSLISLPGGVLQGAFIATCFDWVMEPAAIKLGFWTWSGDGSVPLYNYVTWFFVSGFLIATMRLFKIHTSNSFARWLLFIQAGFFLLIRIAR